MPFTNYTDTSSVRVGHDVVDFDDEHKVRRGVVLAKVKDSTTEFEVLTEHGMRFSVHWLTMRKVGTLGDALRGMS